MQLSVLAIRNPQFTWMIFILLLSLGVVSFFTMPRSEDPQFDMPSTVITVINPGTNALDMEKLVVDPIEAVLNELDDVSEIKTEIEDSLAVIHIEFIYGVNPDDQYDDVVSAVEQVRAQLPSSIQAINYQKITPTDVSILQLAMVSDQASYLELKKHVELLEQRIERQAGVKRADVAALPELEVQIQVDQRKVNSLGIGLEEIHQAVRSAAQNLPGGYANAGSRRFTVRTSGDYESLQAIADTVIRGRQGKLIYLRDIATITHAEALPSYRATYKGEKAVFLSVVQREGTQIFAVREAIEKVLEEYRATRLPDHIRLDVVMDQSDSVKLQIDGFFDSLNQGLLLVAALTLLALGLRPALVVVAAIPMSIFVAIGWVDLSGFGLHQISIVGLVIALGLLVDNAIVVVEIVTRKLRDGLLPLEAAVEGSRQVSWAIISGTLTTVLAYFPMLMMQNSSGEFMRAMPVTVMLTLIASLLIALTLTPLLASRLGNAQISTWTQRRIDQFARTHYVRALNYALQRPWRVLAVAHLLLVGAVLLFPYVGVSLFPKAEKPMLFVNIDMPEGATFEETEAMAIKVEALVNTYPNVQAVARNVGRGNPRVYYNIMPTRQTVNYAQLYVLLDSGDLRDVDPFVTSLRERVQQIPGAQISIKEFMQGPPVQAPVEIRVLGEELLSMRTFANQVVEVMETVEGLTDIDNPVGKHKVDLHVEINRDKAAMLGIPLERIDQTIRTALVGSTLGLYRDQDGEEYNIVLRLSEYPRPELATFEDIRVMADNGALIPLMQIASLELQTSIARFQHYATERMARVTAQVQPGYSTDVVTNVLVEKLQALMPPDGVYFTVGGEQESRKKAFGGMLQALLVAVLGIFAVLVLQFRSFIQPLIVFAAIPFAIIGAVVCLFLAGYSFSFSAFIGVTSLVGIVINNSIILVDYANQMQHTGLSRVQAVAASAQTRLLPILLTSMTTIGGLLPLTLMGSSMWAPLGWTIIGGLTTSTVLTLIVVPVLYVLLGAQQAKEQSNV